ncbi:uncharacterized protein [Maniola hyperantus]|uniref:uncharacterized protein n=1 Tax=Aphantopus hyperantus TaxID=2795564 RepID=UPI00374798D9
MGALWQYIFMLIVLVFQVKGQIITELFPKAGDYDELGSPAFPETHDDLASRSAPKELSADSSTAAGSRNVRRPYWCYLSPDRGECTPRYPRFFYDSSESRCKMFMWSGCGGNGNRFLTRAECMMTCH